MSSRFSRVAVLAAAWVAALAPHSPALAQRPQLDSATVAGMRWRAIGPANMAGRITDIEGIPFPSRTFYVAAAAGGIWKTTNAGTTFRPLFDDQRVISMGDLAIAPSDTNVLYAGTGEEDSRNSISPGGGVYKSTDGGMKWTHVGLTETQAIGRIVVHPRDPNTVYVAALGHIWGPNKERGLYKTTDGGKTWALSKFISDRAGFVDVVMHPTDPNTLYAASWERVRGPYFLKSGGPGSALWKTTDAGATWTELKGGGFPETMKGRIGIAIAPSNGDVVYALVEADSAKGERRLRNGLYRSADAGATWTKMNDNDVRPFYYSQVRVHPTNPDKVWWSSTPVNFSEDGGKTVRQASLGVHVDHHAMWIDPNEPEHHIVGNDGGVAQSWDGGGNYDNMNQMPLGQFYEVSYDYRIPYHVCGGLQDNGSWCGPSRRKDGDLVNALWYKINGGDGFFTQQDPTDPNTIYAESQGGNITRYDYRAGSGTSLVKPSWRPRYMQVEDSILVLHPDTTKPLSRDAARRIAQLRQQQKADSVAFDLRWNWNTPFLLSPHNPSVFYAAANRVLKSTKRGNDLYPISPDLSKRLMPQIDTSMNKTGGITLDATGAETYGTITALAESPVRPGILYAGTDDGNVWLTRNDGATWENLTTRFPGVPPNTYVRRIEPSRFDSSTVYVAFDNHRVNDLAPYLFASTDFGATFRSIAEGLPTGGPDFVHVIREDPHNRDLLFVGTDVGVYASVDRGASWHKFMTGLPTVPVHDLQIHPRERELIAATHGRSIWIVNILPLEQMADSVWSKPAHLFAPKIAHQYGEPPVLGENTGHKLWSGDSPSYGAELVYRIAPGAATRVANGSAAPADAAVARPDSAAGRGRGAAGGARGPGGPQARLIITDVRGDTVQTLTGPARPGIHSVTWNYRGKAPPRAPLSPAALRDSIVSARKVDAVLDSMVAEGTPQPVVDRVKSAMAGGDLGALFRRGRGGGGGAAPGEWQDRPGESPPPREAPSRPAGAPAAGAAGAGAGAGAEIDQDAMSMIFRRLRSSGAVGGFGGFGGGAPFVPPGEYLVTLEVGGERSRQVVVVEGESSLAR
jgi:photosystem II stability/assembly factor-like uncharacterized protein